MRAALWAIPFLAGCSSMTSDYKLNDTEDGSHVYSITGLYGGDRRPRELAVQFMDTYARNMCDSGYTVLDEVTRPVMGRLGEVMVSRLTWKIKCDNKTEAPPPR